MHEPRRGEQRRETGETNVHVALELASGPVTAHTGIPFFDHMLDQLGRHTPMALKVEAAGDLEIDAHHTVEDVGITLGEALTQALGNKAGIRRYGDAIVPMEESLALIALDLSGRPLLVYDAAVPAESIGQYDTGLTEEFFQALCRSAGLTLHVRLLAARDAHHAVEAIFKGVARALGEAVAVDPARNDVVPSTKGIL